MDLSNNPLPVLVFDLFLKLLFREEYFNFLLPSSFFLISWGNFESLAIECPGTHRLIQFFRSFGLNQERCEGIYRTWIPTFFQFKSTQHPGPVLLLSLSIHQKVKIFLVQGT